MDVFKFLDDAVRGTVAFVYGFARSTLTLVVHPLRGPARLIAAARDPAASQIGPTTYLALAFAIAPLVLEALGGAENVPVPGMPDLARLLATGSLAGGLGSLLAGAVAGTITIDALLRLIGRLRLAGARHRRFVAVMEYEIGLSCALGWLLMTLGMIWQMRPVFYLGLVPFYLLVALMGFHFYSLLLRRPRPYASAKGLGRRLRRLVGIGAGLRHLVRRPARLRALLGATLRASAGLLAGLLLLPVPFLIQLAGVFAQSRTATWLAGEQVRAAVVLLDLNCDFAASPGAVRALAWNGSGKPAIGWLDHLALELQADYRGPRALAWRPARDPAQPSDLLMPGTVRALRGELVGPIPESIRTRRLRNPRCIAFARGGSVRISSEGDRVLLPPPAR